MPEMVEDGRLKGGTLAFILEARVKGRFRRMTIGRYPDWSVEKARALALEWKSLIAEGRDPIVEREREWNEPTFKDLAARYIEDHAKQHKSSWQRDEARIEAHFGKWANRRLSDITGGDVAKAQQEIATRDGKIAFNRAMTLLRAMYNLAADWKLFAGENPAARLRFFPEGQARAVPVAGRAQARQRCADAGAVGILARVLAVRRLLWAAQERVAVGAMVRYRPRATHLAAPDHQERSAASAAAPRARSTRPGGAAKPQGFGMGLPGRRRHRAPGRSQKCLGENP